MPNCVRWAPNLLQVVVSCLAVLPSSQIGHLENRSTLSQQQAKPLLFLFAILVKSGARVCT